MTVYDKAIDLTSLSDQRIIGTHGKPGSGSSYIVVAGTHGNEQSGVVAMEMVFKELKEKNIPIKGYFIGLIGNLNSKLKGERFEEEDLNRLWTKWRYKQLRSNQIDLSTSTPEVREMNALLNYFITVKDQTKEQVFFTDLHTTSSVSAPFMVLGDTFRNRKFAMQLPVCAMLGIDEQIEGTMSGFLNDMGYVSCIFEAGEHFAPSSVDRQLAAIWIKLVATGLIESKYVPRLKEYKRCLKAAMGNIPRLFESKYHYKIKPNEKFKMEPGFDNFTKVDKGTLLAHSNGQPIYANFDGYVFMPLYQEKGEDGFFLVIRYAKRWIALSWFLRRLKVYKVVTLLPGIRKHEGRNDTLVVNTKVARFGGLEFLHLLGFRKVHRLQNVLYVTRRIYDFKGKDEL